jgi:D-alanyl-D-alanine carboxypeptidase
LLVAIAAVPALLVAVTAVIAAESTGTAEPLPACRYADLPAEAAGYDQWQRTLVDTIYRLPAGYAPPDLVDVTDLGVGGAKQVRSFVVDDLRQMAEAARQAGAPFAILSAYRSEDRQVQVLASLVGSLGTDAALSLSARPGHSEHELGTAVDLTDPPGWPEWQGDWGESPQGRWLAANSWRYGFVMSYPRASSPGTTCYEYEPWHFRYFGRQTAAAIHDSGLAPRAYLWRELQAAESSGGQSSNALANAAPVLAFGLLLALGVLILWARLRARRRPRHNRPRTAAASQLRRRRP